MSKTKVAINIVTWNSEKYLPFCLESIFKQTYQDFSILVIDNASTDNTVKFIQNNYPEIKIVKNRKNLGFAKAHNQAIAWTDSDYVLCLNPDVILEENFLEGIVKFMDEYPLIGAVSGKLLSWDFDSQSLLTKPKKSDRLDSTGLAILKSHQAIDRAQGEIDSQKFSEIKEIFGPSGAAPVYRREALEDIKLMGEYFDEDFFIYKEDIDLAYRLRLRGWFSYFFPQSIAYHQRRAKIQEKGTLATIKNRSLKSEFVNYHSYKNHLYTLIKNEFLVNIFLYFPWIFWYEFKKLIYLICCERKTLMAWREIIKKLRKMLYKRFEIFKRKKIKAKDLRKWIE